MYRHCVDSLTALLFNQYCLLVQDINITDSPFYHTGYSIFVVMGKLPESEADQLLKLCPAKPEKKPPKTTSQKFVNKSDLTAALQQVNKLGGEGNKQVSNSISSKFKTFPCPGPTWGVSEVFYWGCPSLHHGFLVN